jgi:L-amino acid N-acyltransferase YncA
MPSASNDSGARRPLNPFLSKDPNQRAKRLARALVSDIITYHPAKHAEGLRDGTLKQLFREEIKKSFEEYIAQVGQQLAESTTYFQEALNEVLGAGKKIF